MATRTVTAADIEMQAESNTAAVATTVSTDSVKDSDKERDYKKNKGMESSVFRFNNVNFVVGKDERQKHILRDVSGKVKFGHVLAVMGPSGAGKTTLISALTLDAFYGTPSGEVTLNGVPLTDEMFKQHAFVVKQQDKHWPYLTTREALTYAAELYDVASKDRIPNVVSDIVQKMGLDSCVDTRCARLSGGQRRRLSLAVALLKQPTLLFLDEPTSGLDAAAASNIMREILRVAREERIIIICSIHQPSTKVYNGFDQIMILSKGREAFVGSVEDATPHFDSIGHPLPPATNPAEHFLDLVNSDFSTSEEVDAILDAWQQQKPDINSSIHTGKTITEGGNGGVDEDDDGQTGISNGSRRSFAREVAIMFRRHTTLVVRDPVLYLGRCAIFLITNLVFAFVYWNARDFTQDQAQNKLWATIWFTGVPTQMGVVAVYALNDEFKSIVGETKNGMVSAVSYILAKTVLVIPIIFIFAIFSIGLPAYVVQDAPGESFGAVLLLWSCVMYVFECAAEMFAVAFDDPIIGMLQFMNLWFASFLFGGFLIPLRDMYWPFKLFYHIMPYSYYVRSVTYSIFSNASWEPCDPSTASDSAICVPSSDGEDVLDAFNRIFPLVENEDHVARDIGILIAIALFYKAMSVAAIMVKTRRVANIQ